MIPGRRALVRNLYFHGVGYSVFYFFSFILFFVVAFSRWTSFGKEKSANWGKCGFFGISLQRAKKVEKLGSGKNGFKKIWSV